MIGSYRLFDNKYLTAIGVPTECFVQLTAVNYQGKVSFFTLAYFLNYHTYLLILTTLLTLITLSVAEMLTSASKASIGRNKNRIAQNCQPH